MGELRSAGMTGAVMISQVTLYASFYLPFVAPWELEFYASLDTRTAIRIQRTHTTLKDQEKTPRQIFASVILIHW